MRACTHGGWAHRLRVSTMFLTLKNSHKFVLCSWRRRGSNLRSFGFWISNPMLSNWATPSPCLIISICYYIYDVMMVHNRSGCNPYYLSEWLYSFLLRPCLPTPSMFPQATSIQLLVNISETCVLPVMLSREPPPPPLSWNHFLILFYVCVNMCVRCASVSWIHW